MLLRVRLTPRGGKNALMKYEAGILHARVSAPPVDGAANKALFALVSGALGVPRSAICFHSGETGRDKVLRIDQLDEQAVETKLAGLIP